VPIKVYYPALSREKSWPVIVFSHGLGGSREGCEYLGRMWASHGLVSIHPQHHGSDETVWKGKLRPIHALKASFEDPTSLHSRVADLQFVLNALEKHVADGTPLGRMADLNRVGIAGHAFGALAALSLCGQHVATLAKIEDLPDPRVKAILALSSPVLFGSPDHRDVYKDIGVPTLHMTGTADDSPVGPTRAVHRRIPFDHMLGAERFLVTLKGAEHLSFSGHLRDRAAKTDPHYQSRVAAASTAFWSAYLADAADLRSWLADGGMERIVGDAGVVEYRESGTTAQSAR
jgi:predicted dienelactone hydrolase